MTTGEEEKEQRQHSSSLSLSLLSLSLYQWQDLSNCWVNLPITQDLMQVQTVTKQTHCEKVKDVLRVKSVRREECDICFFSHLQEVYSGDRWQLIHTSFLE